MKPANDEPRDARDADAAAGPDTRPTSPPTQSNRPVEPTHATPSSRVPPTASIRDLPSVDVPVSPERGATAPKTRPSGASDAASPDVASPDVASAEVRTAAPSDAEGADEAPNDRGTTMQSRVSPFARAAATAWETRTTSDDAPLDVNTTQRSPNSDLRAAPLVRDDGRTALLEERVDALEVRLRLAEKSAANERWRVTVALVVAAIALVIAVISL